MVYQSNRYPPQLGEESESAMDAIRRLALQSAENVKRMVTDIVEKTSAREALAARGITGPQPSFLSRMWAFPWPVKIGAVSLVVLAVIMVKRARRRRSESQVVSNPRVPAHLRSKVENARKFRKDFHWGIDGNKVSKHRISKPPKVAVKLGELHSVVYKTKKRGESAQFFEHEFERSKPMLAMDIDNRKLHIVGGGYTVTDDGITG